MEWVEFESTLKDEPIYTIDNNSTKNIVLFGNCHTATIGFILNDLFNKEYNIHIIISWYCFKVGYEHFDMEKVNEKILSLIKNSDIFLFHRHLKNYGVNALDIQLNASNNAKVYELPNFHLLFDTLNKEEYLSSMDRLEYNIVNSDFKDFKFIIDNSSIQFFNIPDHPTHYILFLLTKCIYSRIIDVNCVECTLCHYYDTSLREEFKQLNNYVRLPGKTIITDAIAEVTGISVNPDYFD
jgi:hypothetical protein